MKTTEANAPFAAALFMAALFAAALLTCENAMYQEAAEVAQDKGAQGPTVITRGGNEDEDLAEEEDGADFYDDEEDLPEDEDGEENPDPAHIGGGEGEYQGIKVVSVTLNESVLTLERGGKAQLTATVDPPEAQVTWVSEKTAAVSVDGNGEVTAHQFGTVKVIAKVGGKRAECAVTVTGVKSAGLYQIVSETEVEEIDLSGQTEATMLTKAFGFISASGEDDAHYEIVLDENETDSTAAGYIIGTGPSNPSTGTKKGLTITVRGKEGVDVTVKKDVAGALFSVCGKTGDEPHLILENITLQGLNGDPIPNTSALVLAGYKDSWVSYQGTLTMKDGSRITGNAHMSSSNYTTGGGVDVAVLGTFFMEGGMIDNNRRITTTYTSTADGGGVYNAGTFEMSGGIIENNTAEGRMASSWGGGVYTAKAFTMTGGSIRNNVCIALEDTVYDKGCGGGVAVGAGTFTMSGSAEIADNKAKTEGGGVYAGAAFNMDGGAIRGNRAAEHGAGVFVATGGTFTKTSGIIYGIDAGEDSNKATDGIEAAVHAMEVMQGYGTGVSTKYYRDTDAGAEVLLNATKEAGWDQ
ncbi:MAG: Ig-like domain-containing protein [Spirochaetaceae bacterium]|jgi:hypothetical protein|nr:Ig-like domain-containing protein [Spirochaetaceae bacterium]